MKRGVEDTTRFRVVSRRLTKVDAEAIVKGAPHYTMDMAPADALYAKILRSPHPHARIERIDKSEAMRLPGVYLVLTHEDVPRIPFTTAGQNFPEPSPYDAYMLDRKVRFVGDRVAVVVASDEQTASAACKLIKVDYKILPHVLDPRDALKAQSPVIHDEPDSTGIYDPSRNLAAHIELDVGDVECGFRESDYVFEHTYSVQYVQHVSIEPHVCIAYLDENSRLVLITATQVPFHVRRIVARVNQIPIARVRVIKPRIGGGFGGKQEVVLEDICAHIALRMKRPVIMELTREEEFYCARTRHPQFVTLKTGVKKDGTIVANQMYVLANTGAYGSHALTVQSNTGSKSLPLYRYANIRYVADVVYTNLPIAGAFRGYGAPQGYFALESHMDEIAHELGLDPLEFRRKNLIRKGDRDPIATKLGEGKEGFERVIRTCGIEECIEAASRGFLNKKAVEIRKPFERKRRGVGFALAMHGTGIAGDDMGGATIKVNEDGSFNLLIGATDLGTGSDTVLAQMAAEILGVDLNDIVVYSSDTDYTPFDVGAYASSTTYVSGTAVVKAAEKVRERLRDVVAELLGVHRSMVDFSLGFFEAPDGRKIHIKEAALKSFYGHNKQQIVESASFLTFECPPPFCACFVEVEVDLETGVVKVIDAASAVDLGRAINPTLAEGQIVGSVAMGIGYAIYEEMKFSDRGKMVNASLMEYKVPVASDLPEIKAYLIETNEPTGPFGVKSVGEIAIDNVAPAVANAIFNATGVRLRDLPFTPEKVLRALKEAGY
ncbi:MAG: xanthine dehydrogenase family protein molybdopterin-binding subunit [bacterium]